MHARPVITDILHPVLDRVDRQPAADGLPNTESDGPRINFVLELPIQSVEPIRPGRIQAALECALSPYAVSIAPIPPDLAPPVFPGRPARTAIARHRHYIVRVPRRRRDFPDVKLYIAGQDPLSLPRGSIKRHIGYPMYLRHLIKTLGLEDCVEFTGILQTEDMVSRMVRSHVCLMCSMIENSPNTLGEAMILGVPTVSAFCGGVPSMATDEHDALFYRADDAVMLAYQIGRIFRDDELASRLSTNAQVRAQGTHDPQRNFQDLLRAYASIGVMGGS